MSHVSRADEILVARLRDTCAENDRLRADFARDKAELRQMLADSENEVERLRAEYEATADRVRKECHRDAKDSPLISRYRILRALADRHD